MAPGRPIASRKIARSLAPTDDDAETLRRAIHTLGDFAHITVRSQRGHLIIRSDGDDPVARLTPIGAGQFGMSFHRHTGRWEPMPFVGDLSQQADTLVAALGAYLQRYDFSDINSGSDH